MEAARDAPVVAGGACCSSSDFSKCFFVRSQLPTRAIQSVRQSMSGEHVSQTITPVRESASQSVGQPVSQVRSGQVRLRQVTSGQVMSGHFSQSVSKSGSQSGQTVSYVFSHSGSQSVRSDSQLRIQS